MDGSENNSPFKRGDLVLVEDMSLFLQARRKKENKLIGTILERVDRDGLDPFYRVLLYGIPKRLEGVRRLATLKWDHIEKL